MTYRAGGTNINFGYDWDLMTFCRLPICLVGEMDLSLAYVHWLIATYELDIDCCEFPMTVSIFFEMVRVKAIPRGGRWI